MLRGNFRFKSFMIHDDCITEDRAWVMTFCRRLKEEGFNQPFAGQSRADIICRNPDMVDALYEAGLRLFIIGLESGSNRVLKFLRKGCTREQNLAAARICRQRGIKIWANYMLGLPTETKEELLETYSMLEEIRPYHCSPAFYTPHPGSDLFAWGQQRGIHLIKNHGAYRRNSYEPKIAGPDYGFVTQILYKSIALGEDAQNPPPCGTDRLVPHPADAGGRLGARQRLRSFLMAHYPRATTSGLAFAPRCVPGLDAEGQAGHVTIIPRRWPIGRTTRRNRQGRRILIQGLAKSGTSALLYKIANSLPRGETEVLFELPRCPGCSATNVVAKVLLDGYLWSLDATHRHTVEPTTVDIDSYAGFDKRILIVRDPRDRLISQALYVFFGEPYCRDESSSFRPCGS